MGAEAMPQDHKNLTAAAVGLPCSFGDLRRDRDLEPENNCPEVNQLARKTLQRRFIGCPLFEQRIAGAERIGHAVEGTACLRARQTFRT